MVSCGVLVGMEILSSIFPVSSPIAHTIFVPPASSAPSLIFLLLFCLSVFPMHIFPDISAAMGLYGREALKSPPYHILPERCRA